MYSLSRLFNDVSLRLSKSRQRKSHKQEGRYEQETLYDHGGRQRLSSRPVNLSPSSQYPLAVDIALSILYLAT